MQLQLKYQEKKLHPTRAFFIRSNKPKEWLEWIDTWNIPLIQLECYAVPLSKQSVELAGLLVIFKNEAQNLKTSTNIHPYGCIVNKLYLPIQSELTPQIKETELDDLLLHHRHFFHPSIGMVGFEKSDQLRVETLIDSSLEKVKNWTLARPGNAPRPPLQRIQMPLPPAAEMLQSLKNSMDTKPLSDIPGGKKGGSSADMWDSLERGLLKTLFSKKGGTPTSRGRGSFGSGGGGLSSGGGGFGSFGSGLFGGLSAWAAKRLEELERRRNTEINRLFELFDKNPDEALRYAIPLDNQYRGRGIAPPSDRLFRGSGNFDLGRLGGGQRIDNWDLGNRYHEMRRKYLEAAKEQLRLKRYRKAAYIYAHLLGDFNSAANVLKQGKYFREAAILYKDHLKNIPAAATCLEEGGLLFEAIDLYLELKNHEKLGDLYTQVGQIDQARIHYQKCVDAALNTQNYIQAASLVRNKLTEPKKAAELLLEGWEKAKQPENCLKTYFDWLPVAEEQVICEQMQRIFRHKTPYAKTDLFLNVLLHVNNNRGVGKVLETTQGIVYEIISQQAAHQKFVHVHTLKQFLPTDRLIGSDCNRFAVQNRNKRSKRHPLKKYEIVRTLYMSSTVKWVATSSSYNQFIVIGYGQDQVFLSRGNWKGHFEYHKWNGKARPDIATELISSTHFNHALVCGTYMRPVLSPITLPANNHFNHKITARFQNYPIKSQANLIGFTFLSDERFSRLSINNGRVAVHTFKINGDLLDNQDAGLEIIRPFQQQSSIIEGAVIFRNKLYYAIWGNYFFRVSPTQTQNLLYDLSTVALKIVASPINAVLRIVISTNKGCFLFRPNLQGMNPIGNKFAQRLPIVDITILPNNKIALAGDFKIEIYDLPNQNRTPKLLGIISLENEVVSFLQAPERDQCAVLLKNGKIEIYSI